MKSVIFILIMSVALAAGQLAGAAPAVLGFAVDMREKGAKGDGTSDDTAAFSAALATGKKVLCHSGDTYLVNSGLVATAPYQVIDMRGCKVKMKTGASGFGLLTLTGIGETVIGGEWDGNKSGNPPILEGGSATPTTSQWVIKSSADRQTLDSVWIHDGSGHGRDCSIHTNATRKIS